MRRLLLLLALATSATAAPATADSSADPVTALREGNRLFREGRLEEAHAAYLLGYDPAVNHPTLAYNTGATSHQLGNLPEAILWYRRAELANPGDPWLAENLSRARADLGLQPYPPPGVAGTIRRHARSLHYLGALVAWAGVALWIARPRRSRKSAFALVAIGFGLYAVVSTAGLVAPRAAVVMEDCSSQTAGLPAGSEVWVTNATAAAVQVAAGSATLSCNPTSVALVAATD